MHASHRCNFQAPPLPTSRHFALASRAACQAAALSPRRVQLFNALTATSPSDLQPTRPSEMPWRRRQCGCGGLFVALALLLAAARTAYGQGLSLGDGALAAGENAGGCAVCSDILCCPRCLAPATLVAAAAGKLLELEEIMELSDSYTGKGGRGGGGGSGGGKGRGRSGSSGVTSTLRRQVQAAQFVAAAPLVYDSSNASLTPDGLNRLPLARNQLECSTCVGMVSVRCTTASCGCISEHVHAHLACPPAAVCRLPQAVAAAVEAAMGAAVSATSMAQLQLSGQYLYFCNQSPRTCFTGWNLLDALELVSNHFRSHTQQHTI